MAYLISMKLNATSQSSYNLQSVTDASILHTKQHYENFPVASILLPKKLRNSVAIIYSFARQADDFADEGNDSIEQRLSNLQGFRDELDLIQAYIQPNTRFFCVLYSVIRHHALPLQPFYDLLDAFSQDVVKTRYSNFGEILSYCDRSANPVGQLLLHLYQAATPENIQRSNAVCSALQLINFYQDIAIDFAKNDGKRRIYLCQDEMAKFGITESDIEQQRHDEKWQQFMHFNVERAHGLLLQGKPLGKALKGRIGFELRMIIAGGERIIHKLNTCKGDIFNHRPQLNTWDWVIILMKAAFKR